MSLKKYNTNSSPFLDTKTPFTLWEKFKVGIFGIFIIPRLILMILSLSTLALTSTIATFNAPENEPLCPLRRKMIKYASKLALLCCYFMNFVISVKGWENYKKAKKEGVKLMLFNHVSYVDAFVLVGLTACSGLSKEGNKKLPILGQCIRGLQNIYVPDKRQVKTCNSHNKNSTKGVSQLIKDRIDLSKEENKRYPMIALAPEGTCGNGRCLMKFRTGAFVPGAPVLPVLLKYSNQNLNPAWTIMNEPLHFIRLLCQFYNHLEITFLDTYRPSEDEKSDPELYAENVREVMGAHLGYPLVDESYNNFYALNKLNVGVSWDGFNVIAPPGVIDENGYVDLTQILKKED